MLVTKMVIFSSQTESTLNIFFLEKSNNNNNRYISVYIHGGGSAIIQINVIFHTEWLRTLVCGMTLYQMNGLIYMLSGSCFTVPYKKHHDASVV
jgi:hypothetical protein